jgi:hypothetical protein
MKPEEAYDFVINIIKTMHNDGRSFTYIEDMMKSVNNLLEFSHSNKESQVDIVSIIREITQDGTLQDLPSIDSAEELRSTTDFSDSVDAELMAELRDKSNNILNLHGTRFVNELRNIEGILNSFDPAVDPLIDNVDKAVNKGVEMDLGAYYLAAYSSSKDLAKALTVYRLVNSMMRYIALADAFYETGNKESYARANQVLEEISATSNEQMTSSLRLAVEKFWPFWQFENMMKTRMLDGRSFSDKDLRYFILFKSSDTPSLYCTVLDNVLDSFSPNVAMVFHYNQALIDILDDYYDIEEDIQSQMPNIFILALVDTHIQLKLHSSHADSTMITTHRVRNRVLYVVEWISRRLDEISVPPQFGFLKEITTDHINRLRSILE